jgi:hypothetical protein
MMGGMGGGMPAGAAPRDAAQRSRRSDVEQPAGDELLQGLQETNAEVQGEQANRAKARKSKGKGMMDGGMGGGMGGGIGAGMF